MREHVEDSENESIVAMVFAAMTGRWLHAIVLGTCLGGAFATAAMLNVAPQFRSVGYVNISPALTPIVGRSPSQQAYSVDGVLQIESQRFFQRTVVNTAIGATPQFVEDQFTRVGRGIESIAERPFLGFESQREAEQAIRANLSVRPNRQATMIQVEFSSTDREQAHAVVQSMLASYLDSRLRDPSVNPAGPMRILEDEEDELRIELGKEEDARAEVMSDPILMGDPVAAISNLQGQIVFLDRRIGEVDALIAELTIESGIEPDSVTSDSLESSGTDPAVFGDGTPVRSAEVAGDGEDQRIGDSAIVDVGEPEASADDSPSRGVEGTGEWSESAESGDTSSRLEPVASDADLADIDPGLTRLRLIRDGAREDLKLVEIRYVPGHFLIKQAEKELGEAEAEYEVARAAAVAEWIARGGPERARRAAAEIESRVASRSLTNLESVRMRLIADRRQLDESLSAITEARAALAGHDATIRRLSDRLSRVEERIWNLDLEQRRDSSDSIMIEPAIKPLAPTSDKRKKLAAVGLVGGGGFGFGLVLLVGIFDRRAFRVRQLGANPQSWTLLGAIPDMERTTDGRVDPRALAASCVHQVRNRIEARRAPDAGVAIAVSSPQQADGKTSVALALAHSYARSGYATVVVDADLVGEGLTMASALADAPGLREVLRSGAVNGEVVEGGIDGLSILPSGRDGRVGPESMRRGDLLKIVGELRRRFEIVILDAGPMPGSVETIPVASSVDGVVVVLRRGRQQSSVDRCIDAVHEAGSVAYGVVLNRALPADCERMVSASAISLPARAAGRRQLAEAASEQTRLSAVVSEESEAGEAGSA